MKIGIDVSQLAYPRSGVAAYVSNLVKHLLERDKENDYILFFSSMRKKVPQEITQLAKESHRVQVKTLNIPPTALDIMWNKLHVAPIEWFIGDVDLFITSDWTEPPALKAKKATIVYDLIVYKHPEETAAKIVATQKRKLKWVKKESSMIFCISESTKNDVKEILGIEEKRLAVTYPGL